MNYKNHFGNKYDAKPYRSGMDKELLTKYFSEIGYEATYENFFNINFRKVDYNNQLIIYTSEEDVDSNYKSYIEDVIYALELSGAKLIPQFKYLRAHHNKVFMELYRDIADDLSAEIKTYHFGTLEELYVGLSDIKFPIVIKSAAGAMSKGVYLAKDSNELIKYARILSKTLQYSKWIWDFGRSIRRKGYIRESIHRRKFILQEFIPGLNGDWKILIFGKYYFIFFRPTKKNDFRASGSGNENYQYGSKCDFHDGLLEYSKKIYNDFNVPHVSLDIAFIGGKFYLIEFQMLNFGTVGQVKSDIYYQDDGNSFTAQKNRYDLEYYYVKGIEHYLNKI